PASVPDRVIVRRDAACARRRRERGRLTGRCVHANCTCKSVASVVQSRMYGERTHVTVSNASVARGVAAVSRGRLSGRLTVIDGTTRSMAGTIAPRGSQGWTRPMQRRISDGTTSSQSQKGSPQGRAPQGRAQGGAPPRRAQGRAAQG